MTTLEISRLMVNFENAHGHEHRIQGITSRAVRTFAERVERRLSISNGVPSSFSLAAIGAPAVSLDLNRTSDEHAATQIAGAWFEALAMHLKV
jgi:hypothetical protein